MNRTLLAAVAALSLLAATDADAQARGRRAAEPAPETQSEQPGWNPDFTRPIVSAYIIPANWYYVSANVGWGLGARYEIKVVPRGFLPKHLRIRDDLSMDAGFDYVRADYGRVATGVNPNPPFNLIYSDVTFNALIPTVGVLWNVHITPEFTVYPKIDTGYAIAWWSGLPGGASTPSYTSFFVQGVAGASYSWGNWGVRGEVGSGMLKLGAQFKF